ncbi:MAG TPA: hypothetical protein VFV67_22565 [Actinophytocola sp.]|uniref:hypothetical protein n=1 Tax=Actinophytocola sp. TaxID=1872138 RepID=UPI002DBCD00E|nr:hypothetical protein [Actinophytocola sp.]HEU5473437.1 hypothetical protein [Actinophytocola sp.]
MGSFPAADAEQAMREAATRLGSRLRTLPDGETGDRRNWIVHILESMRAHPDLEPRRDGDFSDYDHMLSFRVRRGHTLRGDTLDFGHVAAYDANVEIFRKIIAEVGLPELTFQVGVPGDLDMALFTLGPLGAVRHRRAFTEATVREIREIHLRGNSSVLFQIEVPVELVFVARMPGPLRPAAAALLSGGIARLAGRAPAGARFGIHLCLGDLGNRALGTMRDATPVVALTNAILKRWPRDRPMEYVHAPFAAGNRPAPLHPEYYRPLSRLRLPAGTRFVAGIVHEDRDLAEHRRILDIVERTLDRKVDVATACGLGRRTPDTANKIMELAAQLT